MSLCLAEQQLQETTSALTSFGPEVCNYSVQSRLLLEGLLGLKRIKRTAASVLEGSPVPVSGNHYNTGSQLKDAQSPGPTNPVESSLLANRRTARLFSHGLGHHKSSSVASSSGKIHALAA